MYKFKSLAFQSLIPKFKAQGFVCVGDIEMNAKFRQLCKKIKKTYTEFPTNSSDYVTNVGADGIVNLPIYVPDTLDLIDEILGNQSVKCFLREILGENYKIWAVNLRRSHSGDKGLYLHQDGVGQLNFVVLLDDSDTRDGVTAFLPHSHLIKKSQKKLGLEIPDYILNILYKMFFPVTGKRGRVFAFTNRLWHGRFRNNSLKERDVIMIGLFASGFKYNEPWAKKIKKACVSMEIETLMATQEDFDFGIISSCDCRDKGEYPKELGKSFIVDIENIEFLRNKRLPITLKLKLTTLFMVMSFKRFIGKISQFLRKGKKI